MLSKKGKELIKLYKNMADTGYERHDGEKVVDAFSDFESRYYKEHINKAFKKIKAKFYC